MIIHTAYQTRIKLLVAVLLLALCLTGLPGDTRAQTNRGHIELVSWSFGIADGQTARVTIVNKDDSPEPIVAKLTLFDIQGNQIAARETTVPRKGFSSMEVARNEIALRGETGGRLQMLAKCEVFLGQASRSSLPRLSWEVLNEYGADSIWIDISASVMFHPGSPDGLSNTILVSERLPSVGLISDQTLRLSLVNDREQPFHAEVFVYDMTGNQLAHREFDVMPGGFNYADIRRLDLGVSGESTGRVQVQTTFRLTFNGQTTAVPDLVPGSVEILGPDGRTAIILLVPAIQTAREAG